MEQRDSSVNRVTLVGIASKAAERKTTSQSSFAIFKLITKRRSKANQIKESHHNISVFANDLIEYTLENVREGDKVYVTGEIDYATYKNKDEQFVTVTNIIVSPGWGDVMVMKSRPEPANLGLDDTIPF